MEASPIGRYIIGGELGMNWTQKNFSGRTILVAEDTDTDFYLLERCFQEYNPTLELTRVCDGVEAIEYLAGQKRFSNRDEFRFPHLLLLDVQMPRKDGFAVLQWIRNQEFLRSLPVVMFSSSGHTQDVRRAYDLGATSYIVKPMFGEYAALVRTLAEYWLGLNEVPDFSGNGHATVNPVATPALEKTK
jgi:CheY-like chemotaxis protein